MGFDMHRWMADDFQYNGLWGKKYKNDIGAIPQYSKLISQNRTLVKYEKIVKSH